MKNTHYDRNHWNLISKMVASENNDTTFQDIGRKNEATKKVGKRVHEFMIDDRIYQVIEVEG